MCKERSLPLAQLTKDSQSLLYREEWFYPPRHLLTPRNKELAMGGGGAAAAAGGAVVVVVADLLQVEKQNSKIAQREN